MKRKSLIVVAVTVAVAGFIVAANWGVISMLAFGPHMGDVAESWETSNQTYKLRIDRRAEVNSFVPGAYYVFRSAPSGSDAWREIMTFRHDDAVPIPREQARFVNDRVGYVFMGWMAAFITDGGASWSVWSADKDLPNWRCCNYRLIKDVRLESDGTGVMILNPISRSRGEVPELRTKDYGRHWSL
ncbi:MAG TPA: hypothetical protein VG148_15895 [Pyrinomonadaceae bacterium]|nr:hypothetical protein [Pyrinomonadaceae bacterium]